MLIPAHCLEDIQRRVPSYYSPQLYADAPAGSGRECTSDFDGSYRDIPAAGSERSSPGLDWLRRTQELHLQTPPLGAQQVLTGASLGSFTATANTDANGDVGMGGDAVRLPALMLTDTLAADLLLRPISGRSSV